MAFLYINNPFQIYIETNSLIDGCSTQVDDEIGTPPNRTNHMTPFFGSDHKKVWTFSPILALKFDSLKIVVKIVVIASPSASIVSIIDIFSSIEYD